MAGWIEMPLGTNLSLGPGHIVLHEDPAPPLVKGQKFKIEVLPIWVEGGKWYQNIPSDLQNHDK